MKLGHRAGNLVLIAATLLFALPMFLVGVAAGDVQGWTATTTVTAAGGQVYVPEPEPTVVEPDNDPEPGVGVQQTPPAQGDVPVQQVPAEPVQPAPDNTEPATPPVIEIPGLPIDPPVEETPEPAPDEPAGP